MNPATEELYRRMKVAERLLDEARQNFGAAAVNLSERSDEFQRARKDWIKAVEAEAQKQVDEQAESGTAAMLRKFMGDAQ